MMASGAADSGSGWGIAAAAEERRPLAVDLDVDVCIVGGGHAGLTVACELARRDWSVAVLEAGRVGTDGLARGSGIVAPGYCEPAERLVARLDAGRAGRLLRLSMDGVEVVRTMLADPAMADVPSAAGHLVVRARDDEEACRREADWLRENAGIDAGTWPAERVRAALPGARHVQALHLPGALAIDPARYALGLAAAARQAGARICEGTRVRAIDHGGIRTRVQTDGATVRARLIVLARPAAELHPSLAGTIVTLSQPLALTVPLEDAGIGFAGAVSEAATAGRAHRRIGDRLLWTGPLGLRPAAIGRQIARTYPHLRGAAMEHTWSSTAHYAVHRMPLIGELAPGLWLAAAFGHHGMATAALAGDLIARALYADDDRWRLFQPFGLVWAGGFAGRMVTGAALAATRLRARIRDLRARRRIAPVVEPPAEVPVPEEPQVAVPTEAAPVEAPPHADDKSKPPKKRRSRKRKRRPASPPAAEQPAP